MGGDVGLSNATVTTIQPIARLNSAKQNDSRFVKGTTITRAKEYDCL
jgi:hypothetical protein